MIRKVVDRDSAHLWMRENLRFSRYDISFMENVARFISDNRSLTIKQNDLWEKIVHKYRKQIFAESNGAFDEEYILNKQWINPVVEFDPSYAPLLWIDADIIKLRFPFNKETVKDLRTLLQDAGHDYGLMTSSVHHEYVHWDKNERVWRGTAYPTLIRDLYYFAKLHEFAIDKSVQDIIDSIHGDEFDWCPFAELHNNGYIVSNLSPGLLKALPPNELTLEVVRDLVGMDITLSDAFQSHIAHKYGYKLGRIACTRELTITASEVKIVKEWINSTDNNLVIIHKTGRDEDINWDQPAQPDTLVPEKSFSIADLRLTGKGLGDYYVFSSDGDNYTLDKGVDCVVYMPGTAFNYEALAHIAKKVITVVEDETSTTNN